MVSNKLLLIIGATAAATAIGIVYYFLKQKPPPENIINSNGNEYEPTSENIQIAIDDLGETGGWVKLPPIAFNIGQTLYLRNNVSLYGYQRQTAFNFSNNIYIAASNAENVGLYDLYYTGAGCIRFTNCTNSIIDNIEAENMTKDPATVDGAISLYNCQGCTVSNCITSYTVRYGIYLNNSDNCTIDHCDVSYVPGAYAGIQLNESDNNTISNNHAYFIGMDPENMTEFLTTQTVGGPGMRCAGVGAGCHGNKFLYNLLHDIREHGIKIYPTGSNNEVCYNEISNFSMGNLGGCCEGYPYGRGLDMGGCSLVKGNKVWMNPLAWHGIIVYTNSAGGIVEDNYVYHVEAGQVADCIQNQADNVTIRNNYLFGLEKTRFNKAISSSGNGCIIENNDIEGFKRGMYLTTANYAQVKYNLIKNCERGIRFDGGTGLTVTDNIFNCVTDIFENEESLTDSILEPNTIIPC